MYLIREAIIVLLFSVFSTLLLLMLFGVDNDIAFYIVWTVILIPLCYYRYQKYDDIDYLKQYRLFFWIAYILLIFLSFSMAPESESVVKEDSTISYEDKKIEEEVEESIKLDEEVAMELIALFNMASEFEKNPSHAINELSLSEFGGNLEELEFKLSKLKETTYYQYTIETDEHKKDVFQMYDEGVYMTRLYYEGILFEDADKLQESFDLRVKFNEKWER